MAERDSARPQFARGRGIRRGRGLDSSTRLSTWSERALASAAREDVRSRVCRFFGAGAHAPAARRRPATGMTGSGPRLRLGGGLRYHLWLPLITREERLGTRCSTREGAI